MSIAELLADSRANQILGHRCRRTYGTRLLGAIFRHTRFRQTWVLVGFYRNGAHFRTLRGDWLSARFHYVRRQLNRTFTAYEHTRKDSEQPCRVAGGV
jgi:hypothetical protein